MELIVITPEQSMDNEAGIVNRLFDLGLQRLHLRKTGFTVQEYRNYIDAIERKYHSRIVLNGSFELLDEFVVGGVHLNSHVRSNIGIQDKISRLSPSFVSTSFHSWQELEENNFEYGYVFISPVFDSISKEGYKAGINLEGANKTRQSLAAKNKYCPKIIGLGGVDVGKIKTLHGYGFDGCAMLGAIWKAEDPVAELARALKVISQL